MSRFLNCGSSVNILFLLSKLSLKNIPLTNNGTRDHENGTQGSQITDSLTVSRRPAIILKSSPVLPPNSFSLFLLSLNVSIDWMLTHPTNHPWVFLSFYGFPFSPPHQCDIPPLKTFRKAENMPFSRKLF